VRAAGRYEGEWRDNKRNGHCTQHGPMEPNGERCAHPAWRIPRRRAHAPGQAEGVDTEGLRGGD